MLTPLGKLLLINWNCELLLCTAGSAGVISQGESMYLEAGEPVRLHGQATVFRVAEG